MLANPTQPTVERRTFNDYANQYPNAVIMPGFRLVGSAPTPKKPIVIVLQSVIGAGKSTLLEILRVELGQTFKADEIVVIPEPVDIWIKTGALADYAKDIKNMCCEFQMFAFATRIKAVRAAYKATPHARVYIIERDPNADKIFMKMLEADGFADSRRMARYLLTWDTWTEFWPFEPTHTIFLKPTLDECQKRVAIRDRDGEYIVSFDYQSKLLKQHEIFFATECKTPVLTIEENGDYRVVGSEVRAKIIKQIREFAGL